jgi:hypothetical protein
MEVRELLQVTQWIITWVGPEPVWGFWRGIMCIVGARMGT